LPLLRSNVNLGGYIEKVPDEGAVIIYRRREAFVLETIDQTIPLAVERRGRHVRLRIDERFQIKPWVIGPPKSV